MIGEIDSKLLHWIYLNRIEFLDGFLMFVTSATTFVSLALIVLVLAASGFSGTGWRRAFQLSITLLIAALLSFGLKQVTNRERPFYKHEKIQKMAEGGGSSFPSGHTLEVFSIMVSLGLLYRKRAVWISGMIWALLIGYSRIALGVHYPGDVLGGMVIGIVLALLINRLFTILRPPYNQT